MAAIMPATSAVNAAIRAWRNRATEQDRDRDKRYEHYHGNTIKKRCSSFFKPWLTTNSGFNAIPH